MLCEDLRLKRYPKHLYAVDGSNYGIAFTLKTEETELLPFLILGRRCGSRFQAHPMIADQRPHIGS